MRNWAIAAALAAATAAACTRNPATGGRQFSLISEAKEIQMGKDYDRQVVASIGLAPDSALQRYLQQFGAQLAARSERPALPWSFRVVDDPVVNAFALPGGFIFVTRGILAHLNSEAELAGVVGHEIGHVTARHQVSRMSTQQLAQIGLVVGSIASSEFGRFAGAASQALGVLFLKYSRDDESQADHLGLRYMRRAGYDARQMPAVFTMLDRVSSADPGGGRVPEWLATHPNPENRRERIATEIAALPTDSLGARVDRNPYLHRLEGLVFGANPRDGYFKGSRFLHPELRFEITFPAGWQTSNERQTVGAVAPNKDAAVTVVLAEQPSAELAVQAFLAQQGITSGNPNRTSVNNLAATAAAFALTTDAGTIRGTLACVEYRGAVFRLLGYAPEDRWGSYRGQAERALASFAPLADSAALNVQPMRLRVFTVEHRTTITELARARPSPVPPATLALLNQVEENTTLEAGTLVKWIVGHALP